MSPVAAGRGRSLAGAGVRRGGKETRDTARTRHRGKSELESDGTRKRGIQGEGGGDGGPIFKREGSLRLIAETEGEAGAGEAVLLRKNRKQFGVREQTSSFLHLHSSPPFLHTANKKKCS